MTKQSDSNGELRAAHTLRLFEKGKRSLQLHEGATGVFMRVTLAVLFLHLVVVSYLMLGILGPVFISILFLLALFIPYFYGLVQGWAERRKERKEGRVLATESRQSH